MLKLNRDTEEVSSALVKNKLLIDTATPGEFKGKRLMVDIEVVEKLRLRDSEALSSISVIIFSC